MARQTRLKYVLTDSEIGLLISARKSMTAKDCRRLARYKTHHREKDGRHRAEIALSSDRPEKFTLFVCVLADNVNDFSVGLNVRFEDGSNVNLLRCNGNHPAYHKNRLEREMIHGYHIHKATERYISRGLEAEGYAMPTDEYSDVDGAIDHMLTIANIVRSDKTRGGELFDNGNSDQK